MALKTIANSIVISRDGGPERLTRTFGTPTDQNVWTVSVWVKIGRNQNASSGDVIIAAGTGAGEESYLRYDDNGRLDYHRLSSAATVDNVVSSAVMRDHTAWHHIVMAYDSDEAVASDRIKLWVDGFQIQEFSTANYPSSAGVSDINTNLEPGEIGRRPSVNDDFDGYMADFHFIDGQALDPTNFAEQNGAAWQPITYTGTYGNEGFLLEFGTAAALGDDTSGNINDWTQVSLDTSNQREDTPSQNHITLNQDYFGTDNTVTLRNGSRQLLAQNAIYVTAAATAALPKTGKYYWEVDWAAGTTAVDKVVVGVIVQPAELNGRVGDDNFGWGVYNPVGTTIAVRHDGGDTNFTDTGAFAVGDYLMVAYDADTGDLWFGRNGTWLDSGNPETGANPAVTLSAADIFGGSVIPACAVLTTNNRLDFRASNEDFEGTVPNGFNTLRVDEWPLPAITDPKDHFEVLKWNGDSSSPRSIAGAQFQPDLAWAKNLSIASQHVITDIIKGAGVSHLNNTGGADDPANAEGDIAAFTSDGITVDAVGGNDDDVNDVSYVYLGFLWKESALAGLDLVSYLGTAASQAVGHNLGEVPDVMYVRNRDTANNNAAYIGKRLTSAGAPVTDPETDYMEFDTPIAPTDSAIFWNDTAPTTTQFTVGTDGAVNADGDNHAAYLWREVEGFSKFTSYIGSGGTDEEAPFIYCGFRPKLVLVKRTDVTTPWVMFFDDNVFTGTSGILGTRGGTTATRTLEPDDTDASQAPVGYTADMCASGVKLRQGISGLNGAGIEYTVMAFADAPFTLASAHSTEKFGDGDIDMPFELGGTGDNPNQYGDGDVELNFLLSGDGDGGNPKADGDIELAFELGGTGTAPDPEKGDGDVELRLELGGLGFNTAIIGSPALPQLTTSGSAVQAFSGSSLSTIPLLIATGDMINSIATFGNARIPQLQTSGDINPDFDVSLPLLETDGTLLGGATLRGGAVIPVLQPSGLGIGQLIGDGESILPLLATSVSGNISTIVSGNVVTGGDPAGGLVLPGLELSDDTFLCIPNEFGATISLPALDVSRDVVLAPGALITGSVTLPIQRYVAITVNGVTLAATVWSMNTETFESTNYLNFDFDSLVSFEDRPYGVTSAGIFLLEGNDDDGTNIDARLLTGISDRGLENLKEVDHFYLQGEFRRLVFQLYPDGQRRLREYPLERVSNSSGVVHARAKGARGLRTRTLQMGLRNRGGRDFVIDKLGLLIRQLTRNTRKN